MRLDSKHLDVHPKEIGGRSERVPHEDSKSIDVHPSKSIDPSQRPLRMWKASGKDWNGAMRKSPEGAKRSNQCRQVSEDRW